MSARYLVGIDLGTTHVVLAYAAKDHPGEAAQLYGIQQLVAAGNLGRQPLLPAFRYHPVAGEIPTEDLKLPWSPQSLDGEIDPVVVGAWARDLGAATEGQLVNSAKSWLSHPQTDPMQATLPWASAESVSKVSPVLASASYLFHVRQSWNLDFPEDRLEDQDIVLTVPASFDERARQYTLEAARLAGLPDVRLLEEPQAAVYHWLSATDLEAALGKAEHQHLLVVDVGGGTTDFSLMRVGRNPDAAVSVDRIGVGPHLMLGGDNLDLTLARQVELSLGERKLSARALSQLIAQTRTAKEKLLAEDAPDSYPVTLLGSGSRLIGGSQRASLAQQTTRDLLAQGFFPSCELNERPHEKRQALRMTGLPYTADAAVTRHLAAFLSDHAKSLGNEPVPHWLLLNGGVFNSRYLRQQLLDCVNCWSGDGKIQLLKQRDLDHAVALGAVASARGRQGQGMRIGGGSARSIFLQLGEADAGQAVCLLPRGTPEGQAVRLSGQRFNLKVGEPVRFQLLTSRLDTPFAAGELCQADKLEAEHLPPLFTHISHPDSASQESAERAVELLCELTEIGTLNVYCLPVDKAPEDTRWQLEFRLNRAPERSGSDEQSVALPANFEATVRKIEDAYRGDKKVRRKAVKELRPALEKSFGTRNQWTLPLLRALAPVWIRESKQRTQSPAHERVWLNQTGFSLRPGFGAPGDEALVDTVWPLFRQGLSHREEAQIWSEWWTFWRRVAGGLTADRQQQISQSLERYLSPAAQRSRKIQAEPAMKTYEDMVRLAASLERVDAGQKVALAGWLMQRLPKPREPLASWWALGRLGARIPFHADLSHVLPPATVSPWIEFCLKQDWRKTPQAAFAAVMISRMSDDRQRDIDESLRKKILEQLKNSRSPESWSTLVSEHVELSADDSRELFGEALPVGLTLVEIE